MTSLQKPKCMRRKRRRSEDASAKLAQLSDASVVDALTNGRSEEETSVTSTEVVAKIRKKNKEKRKGGEAKGPVATGHGVDRRHRVDEATSSSTKDHTAVLSLCRVNAAEQMSRDCVTHGDLDSKTALNNNNSSSSNSSSSNKKKKKKKKNGKGVQLFEDFLSVEGGREEAIRQVDSPANQKQMREHLFCTSKVCEYQIASNDTASHGEEMTSSRMGIAVDKKRVYQKEQGSDEDSFDDDQSQATAQETVLEGMLHNGLMYLMDARRNIFSAQRGANGELVRVGTFDEATDSVNIDGASSIRSESAHGEEGVSTRAGRSTDAIMHMVDDRKGATGKEVKKEGGKQRRRRKKREGDRRPPSPQRIQAIDYPFHAEDCDHCETSASAFADIAPILTSLAATLTKEPQNLKIYDPYYCQGATIDRLSSLGFPHVYNRKEDCYEVWRKGRVPDHDVLVTNPPFSGDHIAKILRFCVRDGAKPWLLLLPNFVYLKDYYESCLDSGCGSCGSVRPFYLTPPRRYSFYSPQGSRLGVKSAGRKTSPFNTFWYIYLGDDAITNTLTHAYNGLSRTREAGEKCCVARIPQQIPYKMMDSNDPRRKKARDRQRSIERIRKKKSEW